MVIRFIELCRKCILYKLKVCGNPVSTNGHIFPTAFAHFMSVSHVGNSHNIANVFIIIIFVMVMCDQWFFYVTTETH